MPEPGAASRGLPFGRYVLHERMARGGMGEVFRAVAVGASGFEKPVVVKRLLPQLSGQHIVTEMFVEEAKVMSRLAHPNIVQVIDFGQGDQDDYFLVLELVDGADLGGFRRAFERRDESVPVPLALYIVGQMLRGLGHAHERAYDDDRVLVHRDVSPANVLLSRVGEVKVADFGVAHVIDPGESGPSTARVVGKPGYMAPEQLTGDGVDPRADVYAVGAVLFELLTHHVPAVAARELPQAVSRGPLEPPEIAGLRSELSADIDDVLARALAPLPERRFASARAMARAIERLRDDGQRLATADELAEAVQQLRVQAQPDAKPVIGLGADVRSPEEPLRELTRLGPDEPFTMRFSDAPEPAAPVPPRSLAPSDAPPESRGPLSKGAAIGIPKQQSGPWLWAAGAALLLVVVGAFWWTTVPDETARASDHAGAGAATGRLVASASERDSEPVAETREHAAGSSAPEPPAAGERFPGGSVPATSRPGLARTGPGPSSTVATAATSSPASEPPPAESCRGDLHLYAAHGWVVRGGPGLVQAPGRYRWPCGSYALTATSRLDPADAQRRTVVIREGRPGVVDLR